MSFPNPSTRCTTELDSFQGYWRNGSFAIIIIIIERYRGIYGNSCLKFYTRDLSFYKHDHFIETSMSFLNNGVVNILFRIINRLIKTEMEDESFPGVAFMVEYLTQ